MEYTFPLLILRSFPLSALHLTALYSSLVTTRPHQGWLVSLLLLYLHVMAITYRRQNYWHVCRAPKREADPTGASLTFYHLHEAPPATALFHEENHKYPIWQSDDSPTGVLQEEQICSINALKS